MRTNQNNFPNEQIHRNEQMKKLNMKKRRNNKEHKGKEDGALAQVNLDFSNEDVGWCEEAQWSGQEWRLTTCWFSRGRLPLPFLWLSAFIVATSNMCIRLKLRKTILTADCCCRRKLSGHVCSKKKNDSDLDIIAEVQVSWKIYFRIFIHTEKRTT